MWEVYIAIVYTSNKPCQCQHTEYWTDYAQWINNPPADSRYPSDS